MSNSWDNYFSHYSDWDEAHCFNVRLELKFEQNIKSLRAFIHSLRVFKTSQERKEIIRMASEIREIKVVST